MKKLTFAIAVLGIAAVSAPAFAADMAVKARPAPAPVYSWTGWYAGLNIGGSWGHASDTVSFAGAPIATAGSQQLNGVIGGGQLGYNLQNSNWLVGLEADIQGSSERANNPALAALAVPIPGAVPIVATGTLGVNEKIAWFGTVRGRLGVLAEPTWLLYVTGGLAYGEVQTSETMTVGAAAFGNNFNTTHAGWTLGGGVEGSLSANWSVKLEYLYIDLGTASSTFALAGVPAAFTPVAFSSRVTDNILRVGVNYHFH